MKVYRYDFGRDGFYKSPRYDMECGSIESFNVSSGLGGFIRGKNGNGYIPLIEVNKVMRAGFYLSFRKLSGSEIKKIGSHWRRLNEDI